MHKELKTARKINDDLQAQQQKISIDIVTVLGIFSGIIMSFVGGLQLFQIAMANLTQQNDFKVLFCVCLIAFVFFNVLVSLFYVIMNLGKRPGSEEKFSFRKMFKSNHLVFSVDIFLIILILIFGALYIGDVIDISGYWKFVPPIHHPKH